jgi:anti-anti-sigma regulatory factor
MTYRIDRLVGEDHLVILRISGRITVEDLNVLRASLEQEKTAVAIDLKDLLFVDREVVKLLALHESNGAELRNCALYIREWITREREAR